MSDRLLRLLAGSLLALSLVGCAGLETREEASQRQQAVKGHPPQQLLELASDAQRQGRLREALSHYERVLKLDPDNDRANIGAGEVLLEMRQPQEALARFDRVLQRSPDMVVALEGRGFAQLGMRRLREAEGTLQRVVKLNPARWRAWSGLGVLADLRRDNATAQSYYAKALLVLPDHPLLLNNRAFSLMMVGRYDQAEGLLQDAMEQAPDDMRIRNNLAWCLAWQKRYSDALEILAHVFPPPQAHNNVGYIAMLQGDYPAAAGFFNKAMALSPTYYERAANNLTELKHRMQQQAAHQP